MDTTLKTFDGDGHFGRAAQLYLFMITRIEVAKARALAEGRDFRRRHKSDGSDARVTFREIANLFGWSAQSGQAVGRVAGYLFDWARHNGVPQLGVLAVETPGDDAFPPHFSKDWLDGRSYDSVYKEIMDYPWLSLKPPTAGSVKAARAAVNAAKKATS